MRKSLGKEMQAIENTGHQQHTLSQVAPPRFDLRFLP
jgi:hypothetical protein